MIIHPVYSRLYNGGGIGCLAEAKQHEALAGLIPLALLTIVLLRTTTSSGRSAVNRTFRSLRTAMNGCYPRDTVLAFYNDVSTIEIERSRRF